ncbi:hypothetical protein [Pusillimonas sp. ANT_WB101]|uniref:hypothetical protein n=1 Tax=Pusillimonas sp. ANT_WB101 TaxID=2597356 RepID=UPI0011EF7E89|nr:hypothetical protein [Pusillimonas sp. ANT_WB101]KAA0910671.1 hypothetical protein FQ179_01990 [Pusillimonas sp. ANT_WB101]
MYKTRIAIFSHQGRKIIVVPLDCSFEARPPWQRNDALKRIQKSATKSGLANTPVAVVWKVGGKLHCLAPDEWHEFLLSLTWNVIIENLSLALACHEESKTGHIDREGSHPDD